MGRGTKTSIAPDNDRGSGTTKKKILAQLMGGKLFFLVVIREYEAKPTRTSICWVRWL